MIARDLINYMIPPLKVGDKVEKARQWMDELRIAELPVTDQGVFKGILSEESIIDYPKAKVIEDFPLNAEDNTVSEDQHYYELLKRANAQGLRLIAVLSKDGEYLGVVSVEDVVAAFANSTSVNTPGAILVLSMEYRDYSLAEISRIIEMDEVKVLSSHLISDTKEYGKVRLTLKVDKEDPTHIIALLESNGYSVDEYFSEAEESDHTQERYDSLMNYLKI